MHLQQPANPLPLTLGGIQRVATSFHFAGIDADECQLADMRVGRDLEHQSRERLTWLDRADDLFARPWVDSGHWWHIERRWKIVDNGVEPKRYALVLGRGPDQRRHESTAYRGGPQPGPQLVSGQHVILEVAHHQLLVRFGDQLDQMVTSGLGLLGHRSRDL